MQHEIPSASRGAFDVYGLLDQVPSSVRLSRDEQFAGARLLESLNIPSGSDYVCVVARDTAYYTKHLPELDLSYHDFRNCDIDTYVPGLEKLADQGLYVLRMGAAVERPINTTHPRIIDYSNSGHRSEFGDIFLAGTCKFAVTDGLGFFALPALFRRPNAFVNFSPFHMFYSSRSTDVGIFKRIVERETGRELTFKELSRANVSSLTRSERFREAGLWVKDNSPEEIADLLLEMNQRLDKVWIEKDDEVDIQRLFWMNYLECIGPEGRLCHGNVRSRIGYRFLKEWSHSIS